MDEKEIEKIEEENDIDDDFDDIEDIENLEEDEFTFNNVLKSKIEDGDSSIYKTDAYSEYAKNSTIPANKKDDINPPKKTLGALSLVFGIASLLIGFCKVKIGVPLFIASVIFGVFGIWKKSGKKLAIAGLICAGIYLLFIVTYLVTVHWIENLTDFQFDYE